MILEGIVTTLGVDRAAHISPMGPEVDESMQRLVLKPFRTSTTYSNLKRTGQAVFHVTDDVELIARAAVGTPSPLPPLEPAGAIEGRILSEACRWYALRVQSVDDRQDRAHFVCDVVDRGRRRDFFGFNRGKHAVLEAAILATRTQFLAASHVFAEFERLRPAVEKTGGPAEQRAFQFLLDHVRAQFGSEST